MSATIPTTSGALPHTVRAMRSWTKPGASPVAAHCVPPGQGWTLTVQGFRVYRPEGGTLYPSARPYETETEAQAVAIGETFAAMLQDALTPAQWEAMRAANVTAGAGVCASHDHCDANMVMDPAFTAVMGREADGASEADAALWSAAWDYAKARRLTASA